MLERVWAAIRSLFVVREAQKGKGKMLQILWMLLKSAIESQAVGGLKLLSDEQLQPMANAVNAAGGNVTAAQLQAGLTVVAVQIVDAELAKVRI